MKPLEKELLKNGIVLKIKSNSIKEVAQKLVDECYIDESMAMFLITAQSTRNDSKKFLVVKNVEMVGNYDVLAVKVGRSQVLLPMWACQEMFDYAYEDVDTFMQSEKITVCHNCHLFTSATQDDCEYCGCIYDKNVNINELGGVIEKTVKCDICGENHKKSKTFLGLLVDGVHKNVCASCHENVRVVRCSVCQTYTEHFHTTTFSHGEVDNMCNGCYEQAINDGMQCSCGALCLSSRGGTSGTHFIDLDDNSMCYSCYSRKYLCNQTAQKYSYHGYDGGWFKRAIETDKPNEFAVGFELEVEAGYSKLSENNCIGNISAKLNGFGVEPENANVIFMRDGSLNNGFEIISHPMTIGYMNKTNIIEEMCSILNKYNFKSHDTTTCGLHFHVSKEYLMARGQELDTAIDRIHMIFETFKRELKLFSRRKENSIIEWCDFLTDKCSVNSVTLSSVKKAKEGAGHSKYVAVNTNHEKTVEFRLFRGSLIPTTIKASMELVKAICDIAREPDFNIEGMDWNTIINHDSQNNVYLKKYNVSKRITSDTKLTITSHFEDNKHYYTIENFNDGNFAISIGDDDFCLRVFLSLLRRELKEKGFLSQYVNIVNDKYWLTNIRRRDVSDFGNYMYIRDTSDSNEQRRRFLGCVSNSNIPKVNGRDKVVEISDLIELWWG